VEGGRLAHAAAPRLAAGHEAAEQAPGADEPQGQDLRLPPVQRELRPCLFGGLHGFSLRLLIPSTYNTNRMVARTCAADLNPETLPDDPALLKGIIQDLLSGREQDRCRIEQLTHYLLELRRHRFGPRSEKLSPDQLLFEFLMSGLAAETPAPASESIPDNGTKKGHGRKRRPADLPRIPVVHDLPEDAKSCKGCGGALVRIGEETAEQLEYVPGCFHIVLHIRPKYACKNCQANVVIAEPPSQPIDKGLPGPGVLAHVVTSKYADHLPLNRQTGIFERHGVDVSRSTLCDWIARSAELLEPVVDAMIRDVLASKVVHTDDTPVPVQDGDRRHTRQGRLWVYVGDRAHAQTVFDFSPNHEQGWPQAFLKDFKGYLQADAYPGYNKLYATGNVIEVGCWAHGRRYFFEAQETHRDPARTAMAYIHELYAIEEAARDLTAPDRQKIRAERARPVLDDLYRWLDAQAAVVLPKSPMGEAITYVRQQRSALLRYLDDGDLSIDNNAAERALRRVAIGRKNWMFTGSDEGGRRAAILYSLVASCQQNGVEPFRYLRDVIERVSTHPAREVAELMPSRWKPPPGAGDTS
jgi:transposase